MRNVNRSFIMDAEGIVLTNEDNPRLAVKELLDLIYEMTYVYEESGDD